MMVRNYLIKKGVSPIQLEVLAFGETRPIATNTTEQGRDLNRRIEFVTLPSLTAEEISSGKVAARTDQGRKKNTRKKTRKNTRTPEKSGSTGSGIVASVGSEPILSAATPGIDLLPAGAVIPGLRIDDLVKRVKFVAGTPNLTPDGADNLRKAAVQLRHHPFARVIVLAHTNSEATEEENLKLSERQASTVVGILRQSGIDRSRLTPRGFGDQLPLVQSVGKTAAAANRRIELRVLQ